MLLLHNQPTSTESVIIGSGHTTRFAHVKGCPYKTDNTEDIGPNIVPVSVFVRMGEGQGWMSGGEAVKKRREGRGVTPALTNVSRPVRGSFGYQGALGAHSVGFCSWAHWPPELSLSRHNELLMTLWVTGRERASTHTAQWRTYASAPCLMSACIHTLADTHTHIRQTLNHTYKCILTRSAAGDEFWGRRTSRLLVSTLLVILMSFLCILFSTQANKTKKCPDLGE